MSEEMVTYSSEQDLEHKFFARIVNGKHIKVNDGKIFIDEEMIETSGYKIISIIDNGANGIVFEGEELMTDRPVAIKLWIPDPTKNKSNKTRSKAEIVKLSKMNSENIVGLYTFNQVNEYRYCVMEYVPGVTLKRYLERQKPYLSKKYELACGLLDILDYCHRMHIYHGDLHTGNIMITDDDKLKVLDFGTSVFNGEYSRERDSDLIGRTLLKILGQENGRLLHLYSKRFKNYSPECICYIMKALAKVSTLLEFGLVDTVIRDMALIVAMVPFFDIVYIESILLERIEKEQKESYYIDIYRRTVIEEILLRHPTAQFQNRDTLTNEDIINLYTGWKDEFIERVKQGKSIYFNRDDKEIFNFQLFTKLIDDEFEDYA